MPHHKSCKKRLKTSVEARAYNRAYKSALRSRIKQFRGLTSAEEAAAQLPGMASMLDRLAKKRIIKRNQASRLKSRLQARVNGLSS
ncbi:MAG: 30S ribosomal protein S20 [Candidatus Krumholzibacteriota bacterium]|nr:30S ribosomal protein S20 [Candidatus Krumholzibacteriota bacterium]